MKSVYNGVSDGNGGRKMADKDCLFCKIANGEIPSATIYENSEFRVILDISPYNISLVIFSSSLASHPIIMLL